LQFVVTLFLICLYLGLGLGLDSSGLGLARQGLGLGLGTCWTRYRSGRKAVFATAFKTDQCLFRSVNISSSGEVVTLVVTVESDFSFGGVLTY